LQGFFNKLEVALSKQLNIHVWQSLVRSVHDKNLQENVVMMDFNKGFCINRVGVACELVDFSVDFLSNFTKEILA
jgi:hypothetical protein